MGPTSWQCAFARTEKTVASSGRTTLVAALRDSVTGQFLVRGVATVEGRNTGTFELSTSVSNLAVARAAFTKMGSNTGHSDSTTPMASQRGETLNSQAPQERAVHLVELR